MDLADIVAGMVVIIGLVGIVVVFLPGLTLQVLAVGIWAMVESSVPGWVVFGIVLAVAIAATVLKYLFPGRRLREAGIPGWLLLVAVLIAIVGLFVIPVVGAPIGFVVTVYAFERARRGREKAWPSTKMALRAVLTSIGIELAGGFLIAVAFFGGALLF